MRNAEWKAGKNQAGFTLIETIITLVVLSIAAVGVLSVFISGMKGSANPLLISQATQLAQGEMDQVVGEKAANGFGAATLAQGSPACQTTMISTEFICTRTIDYVDPGALNNPVGGPTSYKHVTVTINHAIIGDVSVDTIIANY